MHLVIHVEHTARAHRQPVDTSIPSPEPPCSIIDGKGDELVKAEQFMGRQKRENTFQFSTLYRSFLSHGADWKPLGEGFGHRCNDCLGVAHLYSVCWYFAEVTLMPCGERHPYRTTRKVVDVEENIIRRRQ